VISDHTEPVLLGIAMLAAVAAGVYPDIPAAIEVMTPAQSRLAPDPLWRRAHDAAHAISRTLATARDAIAEAGTALATLETARR
jgi:ribulose kinase